MKNRNVVLVCPNHITSTGSIYLPQSLLYLSGAIRDVCENSTVFDFSCAGNTPDTFEQLLSKKNPSIIGINCLFSGNFRQVVSLSEFVKSRLPETKVVIGGIHPTIFHKEIMQNCSSIDAIVLGEGEVSFRRLLEYYFGERDTNELDGVTLRGRGGNTVVTIPKSSYIEDLDSLPTPGYEFLELDKYRYHDTEGWLNPKGIQINTLVFPLVTSRSCPNQCNFCAAWFAMGKRIRYRSAHHVFNEIQYLHNTFGVNYFPIIDDNFTFDRARTIALCKLIIQSNLNIYLDFPNGVMIRTLDEEVISYLCEAGMFRMSLAIESGSDNIRNQIMHKNVSEEKILDVVSLLNKRNIFLSAFFMLGMPEETNETCLETFTLIEKLNVNFFLLHRVIPFPGTKLFDQCMRDNLFTSKINTADLYKGVFHMEMEEPKDFSVKPYDMEITDLMKYDEKIRELIAAKNSDWVEFRNASRRTNE